MAYPTNALFARGTLLKIGDGGGTEVFTTIAEVKALKGPMLNMKPIDVTNHDTPSPWDEFIPGILSGGSVTFTLNFQPQAATHSYSTGLVRDMINRTSRHFRMVFTDVGATTWPFTAFVEKFDVDAPVDKELTANVSLKITGVIVLS